MERRIKIEWSHNSIYILGTRTQLQIKVANILNKILEKHHFDFFFARNQKIKTIEND